MNETSAILDPAAQWNELLATHDAALAACLAGEGDEDANARTFGEAFKRLLAMPAPNAEAVRWKIRELLKTDTPDDSTDIFTGADVAQTLADADRFLLAGRG